MATPNDAMLKLYNVWPVLESSPQGIKAGQKNPKEYVNYNLQLSISDFLFVAKVPCGKRRVIKKIKIIIIKNKKNN